MRQFGIGHHTIGILVLVVMLIGGGLRLYQLGAESFSYDEGIMIEATSSGWATVKANITRGRPPLIVLLGYGWIQLVGESELAVRLLPAIMGILSIGLVFRIGQTLFNDTTGLLAAATLSLSAFHLFHSQDYRYYSLLTLMTLLSTYFYLRCFVRPLSSAGSTTSGSLGFERFDNQGTPERPFRHVTLDRNEEDPKWKWSEWGSYVLFSALVYYAHYQGIFALIAQGLFFLTIWFQVSRRSQWRWFLSQLTLGVLLLPSFFRVLIDFTAGRQDGNFQGTIGALGNLGPLSDPPFWLPFHTLLIKFHFISIGVFQQLPIIISGTIILLVGVAVAQWQSRKGNQPSIPPFSLPTVPWTQLRFLILWALCPVFLPFILSKLLSPMYLPRYTISALPAIYLLLSFLLIAIRRRVPIWASLGAILVLSVPGIVHYYNHDFKDQWRSAAEYVREDIGNTVQAADLPGSAKLLFVSVNNETADRIQLLFGRYFSPNIDSSSAQTDENHEAFASLIKESCALSAGLTPTDSLPAAVNECLNAGAAEPSKIWLVSRNAKDGPQQVIEEQLLSSVPKEWRQINEEHFSGVVARLYVPK